MRPLGRMSSSRFSARTIQALVEIPSLSAADSAAVFSASGRRSVMRASYSRRRVGAGCLGRGLRDVDEIRVAAGEPELDVTVG